jgi:hypothetical protein
MNQCAFKHFVRNFPTTDSTNVLSVGLPGREKVELDNRADMPKDSDRVTPIRFPNRPGKSGALPKTGGDLSRLVVAARIYRQ